MLAPEFGLAQLGHRILQFIAHLAQLGGDDFILLKAGVFGHCSHVFDKVFVFLFTRQQNDQNDKQRQDPQHSQPDKTAQDTVEWARVPEAQKATNKPQGQGKNERNNDRNADP